MTSYICIGVIWKNMEEINVASVLYDYLLFYYVGTVSIFHTIFVFCRNREYIG